MTKCFGLEDPFVDEDLDRALIREEPAIDSLTMATVAAVLTTVLIQNLELRLEGFVVSCIRGSFGRNAFSSSSDSASSIGVAAKVSVIDIL